MKFYCGNSFVCVCVCICVIFPYLIGMICIFTFGMIYVFKTYLNNVQCVFQNLDAECKTAEVFLVVWTWSYYSVLHKMFLTIILIISVPEFVFYGL